MNLLGAAVARLNDNIRIATFIEILAHCLWFFWFSPRHVPNNSVAPFTAYKHTQTTHSSSNRSDEGLTLETPASKLSTVANLRYELSW